MRRGSMKKFLLLMMIAGVMCACETTSIDEELNQGSNENVETEIPEGYIRLDLLVDEDEESRTAHSGDGKLIWSNEDVVTVNGSKYEVVADGNTAHVYVPESSTYTVFYPSEIRVNSSKRFSCIELCRLQHHFA